MLRAAPGRPAARVSRKQLRELRAAIKNRELGRPGKGESLDQLRGMDITITTSAGDDKRGRALLEAFNFPFRK